jgi:membrane protein YqaA with SNARE-associated domain
LLELSSLLLSAFLAATILPGGSEIILAKLVLFNDYSNSLLLSIATIGNVFGSLINYILGLYLAKLQGKKFIPITKQQIKKYSKIYQKYGIYSLLFAFLPIIGDPLTIIAGIFRANIWLFLLFVTIGKFIRYVLIISIF